MTNINLNSYFMGTQVVNLTPHDLNFYKDGVLVETIPASGVEARCDSKREVDLNFSFPVNREELGNIYFKQGEMVISCPDFSGVLPITSLLCRQKLANIINSAVLSPDTGVGAVRDKGKIIGTTGFIVSYPEV